MWKSGLLVLLILGLGAPVARGQVTKDFTLYAGFGWFKTLKTGSANFELKDVAVVGGKGGVRFKKYFGVEGNVGYLPHMELQGTDPKNRGILYEANFVGYFPVGEPVEKVLVPFALVGGGGLKGFGGTPASSAVDVDENFSTFHFGFGFKLDRVAGPLGFRFEYRRRTLFDIANEKVGLNEFTGGFLFTWND
ncbi:MAG: outer membrane beta-barrel protein [Acidobacteria bacterium]|nr:outer membrane beta-barrel protein [Acidobacteriota bacterium]